MTWLDCNRRSYTWIFGWTLREDVRLACAQMPELFFDLHVSFQLSAKEQKIIYANLYLNTIIDGDSQTSPLPIFPEGVGTSVHRLERKGRFPRSLVCGRMKKERYRKQDVSVSDLVQNKNVSLPLSFFTISISKSISLFLGKMFKLVIHRPSFITSFENRRVKKDSEQLEIHDSRSTTSRWQMMMMKNNSAEVDERVRGTFTQMYFVRNF